jgi:hypothetical protein
MGARFFEFMERNPFRDTSKDIVHSIGGKRSEDGDVTSGKINPSLADRRRLDQERGRACDQAACFLHRPDFVSQTEIAGECRAIHTVRQRQLFAYKLQDSGQTSRGVDGRSIGINQTPPTVST